MTLTQIDSQSVTASFTGTGLDVSGFTGDWTIKLNVTSMANASATPVCRFVLEDTVNNFTASLAGPTVSMLGQLGTSYDKVKSFRKQDFPDLRMGVVSSSLRLKLANLTVGSAITYRAWIES